MKPHEQRVVDERKELHEKVEKLEAFIRDRSRLSVIEPADANLLIQQFLLMCEYRDVLDQRIARFQ
jgi:hypothetical protein